MARAAAWRAAGLGSRGAAELRGQQRRGDEERERRIELARCELDAGSSSRALNALPPAVKPTRWNSSSAPRPTVAAAGVGSPTARQALSGLQLLPRGGPASGEPNRAEGRIEALTLVVECGTEAGDLAAALAAWRELEASGATHDRRGWLGRRLGVALARSGFDPRELDRLASALPNHERCLTFWRSVSADVEALNTSPRSRSRISTVVGRGRIGRGDRHGCFSPRSRRAREATELGGVAPSDANPAEASGNGRGLLDADVRPDQKGLPPPTPASDAGRPNTAIRTLRSAFPGIATIAIARVPTDAALAYLPLRWSEHVAAARETGLDPWLIAAVARQESTFSADARSPAGARGVMQLLPSTARLHARPLGLGSRRISKTRRSTSDSEPRSSHGRSADSAPWSPPSPPTTPANDGSGRGGTGGPTPRSSRSRSRSRKPTTMFVGWSFFPTPTGTIHADAWRSTP